MGLRNARLATECVLSPRGRGIMNHSPPSLLAYD
jgi:hypothetical protein